MFDTGIMCTELQSDTRTSMESEKVSWVKWVQIPLRQAEMYMKSVCGKRKCNEINMKPRQINAGPQQTKGTVHYLDWSSDTGRWMKVTRQHEYRRLLTDQLEVKHFTPWTVHNTHIYIYIYIYIYICVHPAKRVSHKCCLGHRPMSFLLQHNNNNKK